VKIGSFLVGTLRKIGKMRNLRCHFVRSEHIPGATNASLVDEKTRTGALCGYLAEQCRSRGGGVSVPTPPGLLRPLPNAGRLLLGLLFGEYVFDVLQCDIWRLRTLYRGGDGLFCRQLQHFVSTMYATSGELRRTLPVFLPFADDV
jgi:hypothetical protein